MFRKILVGLLLLTLLLFAASYWLALDSMRMKAEERSSFSVLPSGGTPKGTKTTDITRLAFGSCNRQDKSQAYWEVILNHQPDAWLWLGDNIYGDTDDLDALKQKYDRQKSAAGYQQLLAVAPVYGIWDDHDYGVNDGGKEWFLKDGAEELMLDFLDVPKAAPVRDYPGTYQTYEIGTSDRAIKLILLDTRYFRDPLENTPRGEQQRYYKNPQGDILGEAQWVWLEKELNTSEAAINLIASSIQVIPEEHGYEKWANFPKARKRILELVSNSKARNIVLLSGDRHIGEISGLLLDNQARIYEVTSSGLTHSYIKADEENKYRLGSLTGQRNYGLLTVNWQTETPNLLFQLRSVEDDRIFNELIIGPAAALPAEEVAAIFTDTNMPTALKPCPESPNCVSTQSTQAKKKRQPLKFSGEPAAALKKLKAIIAEMSRTKLVGEQANYLHYEFKTFPIPFIDDVEFLLDEEAQVIHYRSASRVGHSDLGVNSKRMAKIAKKWAE